MEAGFPPHSYPMTTSAWLSSPAVLFCPVGIAAFCLAQEHLPPCDRHQFALPIPPLLLALGSWVSFAAEFLAPSRACTPDKTSCQEAGKDLAFILSPTLVPQQQSRAPQWWTSAASTSRCRAQRSRCRACDSSHSSLRGQGGLQTSTTRAKPDAMCAPRIHCDSVSQQHQVGAAYRLLFWGYSPFSYLLLWLCLHCHNQFPAGNSLSEVPCPPSKKICFQNVHVSSEMGQTVGAGEVGCGGKISQREQLTLVLG